MSRSKYINTFNTTADYDAYIESAYPSFPNVAYDKQADKMKIQRTSPNSHMIYMTIADTSLSMQFKFFYNNTSSPYRTLDLTNDSLNNTSYADDPGGSLLCNFLTNNTFNNKTNITAIKKLNLIRTGISITNASQGFASMTNLTQIDLSSIDLSAVTTCEKLFYQDSHLLTIDLSNTSIGTSCTSFNNIFNGCTSLTTVNLNNCDLSSLTNKTNMFYNCNALRDVYVNREGTLNMITNNLTSEGGMYVPSNNGNCTIHYNNGSQTIDYKWQNNAWTAQS